MKIQFKRLLALVLGMALLFGMVPGLSVSAAETETVTETGTLVTVDENGNVFETEKIVTETRVVPDRAKQKPQEAISTFSLGTNGSGGTTFTTFEDLKTIVSAADEHSDITYVGEGPLVFTEDITIPDHFTLHHIDEIQIKSGVTVTAENFFPVNSITIDGKLIVDYLIVSDKLVVNGNLHVLSFVDTEWDTEVTGMENITYENTWCTFGIDRYVVSLEELKETIAIAGTQTDPHIQYWIYCDSACDITESVTIPENTQLGIWNPMTVTKGNTLTLLGSALVYENLTVEGSLVNNGYIRIEYDWDGLLTIAEGGSYSGDGNIDVYSEEMADKQDLQSAVPGLDLSTFEATNFGSYWYVRSVAGLTKLGNPSELEWGKQASDDRTSKIAGKAGDACWKDGSPSSGEFQVNFYKMNGTVREYLSTIWVGYGPSEEPGYVDTNYFANYLAGESGDYCFSVTVSGDYETTCNSDEVFSDVWTYVKPTAKLGTVTDLTCKDGVFSWKAPSDGSSVDDYGVRMYYSSTETGKPRSLGTTRTRGGTTYQYYDDILQEYGVGYYYIAVQARSADIEKVTNGDWSELSPAYHLTEVPEVQSFDRIFGADRYQTAFYSADLLLLIQGRSKFDNIVVACGTDFADALSGSYLANQKDAPILLVRNRNKEINAVKDYIKANLKPGGTVYLLGGTNAVPKAMETGLGGFNVKRLAGATRYETNLEILKEAGASGKPVLVCTGKDFADGLSASAVNLPILLVKDSLIATQKKWIESVDADRFYIIGGKNAVNARIENALKGYGETSRIEGATRYYTSVNIAKTFFDNPYMVVLAYGENFPDGLSAGPLAYSVGAPLILTKNGKQAPAVQYAAGTDIEYGLVLGGPGLIPDKVANAITKAS